MAPTRQYIRDNYKFDCHGRIKSPGKFEGQKVYAPYYWELTLEGGSDELVTDKFNRIHYIFNLDSSDVEMWPELSKAKQLRVHESDLGFVSCIEIPL